MREARLTALLIKAIGGGHVPEAGRLMWSWFRALSDARTWNAHRPNPISYAEIEAFARLYRLPMEPRHIDMLRDLDRAFMRQIVGAPRAAPAKQERPVLTAALYDALCGMT